LEPPWDVVICTLPEECYDEMPPFGQGLFAIQPRGVSADGAVHEHMLMIVVFDCGLQTGLANGGFRAGVA
jgi:hypothetical protein